MPASPKSSKTAKSAAVKQSFFRHESAGAVFRAMFGAAVFVSRFVLNSVAQSVGALSDEAEEAKQAVATTRLPASSFYQCMSQFDGCHIGQGSLCDILPGVGAECPFLQGCANGSNSG